MILSWVAVALVAALVVAFAWWRFAFFHRNPDRVIAAGDDPVCPADGKIVYIEELELGPQVASPYHRRVAEAFGVAGPHAVIATYLGIFDVHVVRAPIAGTVRLRHLGPVGATVSMGGSFIQAALRRPLPVGQRGYLDKNEFLGVELAGEGLTLLLVLMADWWIDQIIPLVEDGAVVTRGQVIGKIQMGSQVDLFAPAGALLPACSIGDRVRAGEAVIAAAAVERSRAACNTTVHDR
jgi:phosphatidylserine decarboxylase